MRKIIILSVLALLAGCATPPNDIKATSVSAKNYSGLSCEQLAQKAISTNHDIAPLVGKQQSVSESDAMGVFWLGLPVGSMSDNDDAKARVEKIARLKGELAAIQSARTRAGCI